MQAAESLISRQRVRWTRARFERLARLGAFVDRKLELVRGELVEPGPEGLPHANVIEYLNELLMPALVGRVRLRVQLPFAVDDETELIPDLALIDRNNQTDGAAAGSLTATFSSGECTTGPSKLPVPGFPEVSVRLDALFA